MLISEFARASGLTADTVRFYVRRGLLTPETGGKGGRNPYQMFTAEHVKAARLVRLAQSLGMSLKEIEVLNKDYIAGSITDERSREILAAQLVRLDEQAAALRVMRAYLRNKIAWLDGGKMGLEPDLPRARGKVRATNGAAPRA